MTLFITLYIVGFLRTLVIIAIIYFGIKFISRYIMPLLIDKGIKNMQQKMQEQQRQQHPKRPEGEVTIEKNRKNNNSSSQNNEEYVDFEEVD
ncbi:DUF4834 family protein [Prolixibacteraceae bacterium Z1-6]|uniref:DUF4834 family protein n=1 Tax=Draconibacterium aestuarii TaxID=2998507 RepID=A0A9X3J709_9BACT|nr:DUF4834 family protein [Prolixibacteraceae bacterium Z1-6]